MAEQSCQEGRGRGCLRTETGQRMQQSLSIPRSQQAHPRAQEQHRNPASLLHGDTRSRSVFDDIALEFTAGALGRLVIIIL